mmetsp:Transcript_94125/g.280900  ORF Transcript_94125/g.280900 Transcript_94125/m.280900 type:complete len:228 (-) Transcript_94125:64-747(-)
MDASSSSSERSTQNGKTASTPPRTWGRDMQNLCAQDSGPFTEAAQRAATPPSPGRTDKPTGCPQRLRFSTRTPPSSSHGRVASDGPQMWSPASSNFRLALGKLLTKATVTAMEMEPYTHIAVKSIAHIAESQHEVNLPAHLRTKQAPRWPSRTLATTPKLAHDMMRKITSQRASRQAFARKKTSLPSGSAIVLEAAPESVVLSGRGASRCCQALASCATLEKTGICS